MAALTSVLQRRALIRVVRQGVATIGPSAVQVMRTTQTARATMARPRSLPEVSIDLTPVARHTAHAGRKLFDALRATARRSVDLLERLNDVAAPMLRSTIIGLGRAATSGQAFARVALKAAAKGFWDARERWMLRRRGVAPYVVSFAIAVVVGWLIGVH